MSQKKLVSNIDDDGAKDAKLTTPIFQTNVSKKVVSNIDDDGVKVDKLTTPIFQKNV